MAPLLFLIIQSARNSALSKLRRLRQPRYAIATAIGLLYFGQVLTQSGQGWGIMGLSVSSVAVVGPLLLLVLVARPWWWPGGGRGGLGFSAADVQVLFPAPVTRRQLVAYRILQSQAGVLFGAVFFAALTQPSSPAIFVMRAVGLWFLMSVLTVHAMVVTLSRAGVVRGDAGSQARRWIPAAVFAVMVAAVVATLATHWVELRSLSGGRAMLERAGAAILSGASGVALWPFRALVSLPSASTVSEFFAALPAVVVMWAGLVLWVMRTDTAFEETAAEQAEKAAQFLKQRSMTPAPTKARSTVFTLHPTGRVEVAFLWKNLIAAGYMSRLYLLLAASALVPVVIGLVAAGGMRELSTMGAVVCLGLAAMIMMIGAMQVNFDLRQDLAHLAVIKSWPVSGATLVRGEVLAPAIVLSSFMALLVAVGTVLGRQWAVAEFGVSHITLAQWAISLACLGSGIILLQVVLQNSIAAIFPAWIRTGPKAVAGVEAMGQQMMMVFGAFLALPILAIPAVLVGAVAWFGLQWSVGTVPVIVPALATTAALLVEAAMGIAVAGRILDRTDISAVGP